MEETIFSVIWCPIPAVRRQINFTQSSPPFPLLIATSFPAPSCPHVTISRFDGLSFGPTSVSEVSYSHPSDRQRLFIPHRYPPILSHSSFPLLVSGPDYWGLMNTDWSLCSKGRRQSPVDIRPEQLLFDPTLEAIQFVGHRVSHLQTPFMSHLLV